LELLSLHGILGITDKAVDALSRSCAATLTALDINGCTSVLRYTTHESLREKLPALTCFVIHK
jgi:F-box/leucine-rich repeat protein 2/20